jgi:hypothetical protein
MAGDVQHPVDLVWTVIPNGVDSGQFRISVFVSIRLGMVFSGTAPMQTLDKYPDFDPMTGFDENNLAGWPARAAAMTFGLEVSGRGTYPLTSDPSYLTSLNQITENPSAPQIPSLHLWEMLFSSGVPATDTNRRVQPYTYQIQDTGCPTTFCSDQVIGRLDAIFAGKLGTSAFGANKAATQEQRKAIFDIQTFLKAKAARVAEQKKEFHRTLALLTQYPAVLRQCALVLDFTMPATVLNEASVRLVVAHDPGSPTPPMATHKSYTPWTRVIADMSNFYAKPGGGSSIGDRGQLILNDNSDRSKRTFFVDQIDPVSEATKYLDDPACLFGDQDDGTVDVCRLRTSGVALFRRNNAAKVGDAISNNTLFQNAMRDGADCEFFADDLLKGYRIDIYDLDRPMIGWRSLCCRIGTYSYAIPSNGVINPVQYIRDEGWVSQGGVIATNSDAGVSYAVHDILARWNGWSLSVPRPERSYDNAGALTACPPLPLSYDDGADVRFLVHDPGIRYFDTAPGEDARGLPQLRFGHRYLLRVRTVDIAGNGLALHTVAPTTGKYVTPDRFVYARFDPVPSPSIFQVEDALWGEGLTTIAIRRYDSGSAIGPVPAKRVLAPPKTTQSLAELHGMLDGAGGRIDYSTSRATLESHDFDVTQSGGKTTHYYIESQPLPYLPDPLGLGIAVFGLPAAGGDGLQTGEDIHPTLLPYHGAKGGTFSIDWPNIAPWSLVLASTAGPNGKPRDAHIAIDERARTLTVYLPPADQRTITVACTLRSDVSHAITHEDISDAQLFLYFRDLETLGMWRRYVMNDQLYQGKRDKHWAEITREILASRNPLFTPTTEVTLVHATQKPLFAPHMQGGQLALCRNVNDISASLVGIARLPGFSADRFEISASWDELIDDPRSLQPPFVVKRTAEVMQMTLSKRDTDLDFRKENIQHQFGDTKYRKIDYSFQATSRFRSFFNPTQGSPDDFFVASRPVLGIEACNSARPQPPVVRYALPVFGRLRSGKSVERKGGGLRIYLNRPWYQTGYGEMLGVVVKSSHGTSASATFESTIGSDIMNDPAHYVTLNDLSTYHFVNSVAQVETLLVESGTPVIVLLHPVFYDKDRDCWYADVVVENLGAVYAPFIQLSLVRYQPNSLVPSVDYTNPATWRSQLPLFTDMSATTKTEFVQLLAERRNVSVTVAGSTLTVVIDAPQVGPYNFWDISVDTPTSAQPQIGDPSDWDPLGYHSKLLRQVFLSDFVVNPTTVTIPLPNLTPGSKITLVEYEAHISDSGSQGRPVYAESFTP